MPTWARYPKIVQSTRLFAPDASDGGEWVVTEKIHGANFSLVVRGEEVRFASRGRILDPSDDFFGFRSQGVAERLRPLARAVCKALIEQGIAGTDASVVVYGELCGGMYPHADVPAVRGAASVQRGCWYSPHLTFVGFDVALGTSEDDGRAPLRFLDFDVASAAAAAAGLQFAAPLCRGTLARCLDHPVKFKSTLPATLGLPPLDDNWAEGVVIRPVREPVMGVSPAEGGRRLFKRKIAEFSEKQYQNDAWRDARFGKVGSGGAAGGGAVAIPWAETENALRYELLAAVSEPRLASVLSKIGRVDTADRQQCRAVFDDLVRDVEEALVEDGMLAEVGELQSRWGALHRELIGAARKLVTSSLRAQMVCQERTHESSSTRT